MDLQLENKIALVTGGGSGVGREITKTLCTEGCFVAVADIDLEKAKQTVDLTKSLPGKAAAYTMDVINWNNVQETAAAIIKEKGRIDILVNNAGYGVYKNFNASAYNDWMTDINVNLIGSLNCARAVIGEMMEKKYGKIVNIVSDAGRTGEPLLVTYSAAKAAVIGFSKSLAKEVGRSGINVNCVALGTTKTPLIGNMLTPEIEKKMIKKYPLGRLGVPEDHAYLVAFLASDRASWITGQVFSVNGGYTMI